MQKKVIVLILLLVATAIPTILFFRSIAQILWFMATHPADSYQISVSVLSFRKENGFGMSSAIAIPFLDVVSGMALPVFLLFLFLLNRERSARRRQDSLRAR